MNNRKQSRHSRLLVLVPENEVEEVRYARKARSLAEYYNLDILFIGNTTSYETEMANRRKLITLAGITNNGIFKTDFVSKLSNSWIKTITEIYAVGDYILCPKEIIQPKGLFNRQLLWEILISSYGSKVIAINGYVIPENSKSRQKTLLPFLYWAGIITIFCVSFGLEANLGNHSFGWIRILGEGSLVVGEIFSLWLWNLFLNRG
jgi:hypothetical protein